MLAQKTVTREPTRDIVRQASITFRQLHYQMHWYTVKNTKATAWANMFSTASSIFVVGYVDNTL